MTRDQAIALMLLIEGGEANVKGDPGGHTKYGITQATLAALNVADPLHPNRTWSGIALPANVADLTPAQATDVYARVQWPTIRGDELPPALAPLVLNAAVNMGEPRAIMLLQDCVGVTVDGHIGAATLYAVRAWRSRYLPGQSLAEEFAARMASRYAVLDNANGNLTQFELGWFRRLFRVYTLAVST